MEYKEIKFEYRIIINGEEYYFTMKDLVNWEISNFILDELKIREPDRFSWMYSNNNEPIFENDILYAEQWIWLTSWKPSSKRFEYIPMYVICKYWVTYAHDQKISWFWFEIIWVDKWLEDMYEKWDYRTLCYYSSIISKTSRWWHYITNEELNGDWITHFYHKLVWNIYNFDINQLHLLKY